MLRENHLQAAEVAPFVVHEPEPMTCRLGRINYAGAKWNSRATYEHAPAPLFMRPTPHFLLVLTLEGEADYRDETGVEAVLRKGTLMWARPGINQSYGPRPGQRWSELYVWFSGPIFDTWQAQGFPGKKTRIISVSPLSYWVKRVREIVQPSQRPAGETALGLLCRFQQLLADAVGFEEDTGRNLNGTPWWNQACQLLDGGQCASPTLEEIAVSLGMSYTTFRKRFAQLAGKSPGRYRSEKIMHRASVRLLADQASVGEIAEELGFRDAFHFSRRFRQIMGMAPKGFRHQHSLKTSGDARKGLSDQPGTQ